MNVLHVVSEVLGPQDPGLQRLPGTEVVKLLDNLRVLQILKLLLFLRGGVLTRPAGGGKVFKIIRNFLHLVIFETDY